jgi:hypothetical protein
VEQAVEAEALVALELLAELAAQVARAFFIYITRR